MNRFVIVDGLPYLLANGKAYTVRFDAEGFTVGEAVDKTVPPYPLYTATEILAKCAVADSIGEIEEAQDEPEEEEAQDEKPLDEMTLAELKEYAKAHDIDLDGARTKATIIEAINASKEQAVS